MVIKVRTRVRGKVLATVAVALIATVLTACGHQQSQTSQKTSVTMMQTSRLLTMDPAQNTDMVSGQTMEDVYSGLYRYDNNQLKPDMAAHMATISGDQKTYTFHLRKNAKWSDGRAVTAQDFVYAWRRAVNPQTKSHYAYVFSGIVNADAIMDGTKSASTLGVTALNKTTLQIKLTKVMPYFESMLTLAVFDPVEKSQVTKYGDQYGKSAKTLTFNGPYKLNQWDGNSNEWVETKNKTYWNASKVRIRRIKYRVIKSSATALKLYHQGKLTDATVTGAAARKAKKDAGYHTVQQNFTYFMEINQARVPALKNQKIREAISMAIDREHFVKKVLANGSTPTTTVVPAGMFYNENSGDDFASVASNGVTRYTTYNLTKARKLFKEGMAEAGLTSFDFSLLTDDTDVSKQTGKYLQQAIETLNQTDAKVTVTTDAVSFNQRVARSQSGDFDVVVSDWSADYPDAITFLDLFTTGGSNNHGNWSNSQYDALINAAQTTDAGSTQKRWRDLVKADQLLTRELGVIPLYQVGQARLTDTDLHGFARNPNGLINWVSAYYK